MNDDAPFAVVGDLHGNTVWARHLVRSAGRAGVKILFQVGDLAVCWPGRDKYKFDRRLNDYLAAAQQQLVFVVGNHDNHEELESMPVEEDGLVHVRENILMLPRGGRMEHAGLSFGSLGGAFSVDHHHRKPGIEWWPDAEEVQREDVEKLAAGGPVDVLLTHDAPFQIDLKGDVEIDPEDIEKANRSRHLITEAIERARPANVFCGHWHQRRIYELPETRVDVLHMDGSKWGNAVLVYPGTSPLRIEPLEVTATNWQVER